MVQGSRFKGSTFWVQGSARPLATEAARLIEDETSMEPKKKVKMGLWERFLTAIDSV
ncbi:MAG: hypothetical protein JRF29_06345 [Deltaproteobacteria bacterium]|jgi:hypothetical protein|nr:hypothetical protein [Deltaproteobacteria bacterium]